MNKKMQFIQTSYNKYRKACNMSKKRNGVLCGGIFLLLLLSYRKQRKQFYSWGNELGSDELDDIAILWGLCYVMDPSCKKNGYQDKRKVLKNPVSSYKQCEISTSNYFPFGVMMKISLFNQEMTVNYEEVLSRMENFVFEKLTDDLNSLKRLVGAILEIISADDNISEDAEFIIGNRKTITKSKLLIKNEFDLAPLLLGVWHYIISHNIKNKDGRETFKQWTEKKNNDSGTYILSSEIGKEWSERIISVHISSNEKIDSSSDFKVIIEKMKLKHSILNSIFSVNNQKHIDEFFVCSDITYNDDPIWKMQDVTIDKLCNDNNYILLKGAPGIGKTMMMHHLIVDACDKYAVSKKIPLYIPLGAYQDPKEEMINFLFRYFRAVSKNMNNSMSDLIRLFEDGKIILFLDGLDEVPQDCQISFAEKLDVFIQEYDKNIFIISSRGEGNITFLNGFATYTLSPFTSQQAESLIDKIAPEEIKEELKKSLENDYFSTYDAFTKTPLFLTLMIKNYAEFKDIPKTQHTYFDRLYKLLYRGFDKAKGKNKRQLLTGLNEKEFESYFAEFCESSYALDKSVFKEYEFDHIFDQLPIHKTNPDKVADSDFREDLIENLGLMVYENGCISFWHKSFQEYFCALYFANCTRVDMIERKAFFAKMEEKSDKNIFLIYKQLVPEEKFENFIFLPYKACLIEKCIKENGYRTFLCKVFFHMQYNINEMIFDPFYSLYKDVFYEGTHKKVENTFTLPFEDKFMLEKRVEYIESNCSSDCFYRDKYRSRCFINCKGTININHSDCKCRDKYSESDVLYQECDIKFNDIYDNREKYKDLIRCLESDDFPLKIEYKKIFDEVASSNIFQHDFAKKNPG